MKSSTWTVWLRFFFAVLFFAVFFGPLFIFGETQLSTQRVVGMVIALSIASASVASLLDGITDLKIGVEQQILANSEMLRELSEIREDLSDLKKKLAPETG